MTNEKSEIETISENLHREDVEGLRAHLKKILEESLSRTEKERNGLLLRVGVHYVSRVLGTWLRAVLPVGATESYSPFGRFPNPTVLETHWDRFYNLVPSETNWFVDERFVGRAVIIFDAKDELCAKDARCLPLTVPEMEALRDFLNTWPGFAEIRVPRGDAAAEGGSQSWTDAIRAVALKVSTWLKEIRLGTSGPTQEFDLQAALYGLLYTWTPTIAASAKKNGDVAWVAYMQAFPRPAVLGEKVGTLGALFSTKSYPNAELDRIAEMVFSDLDPNLDCLLAAESQVMAQLAAQGARRSVTVERIIRRVRFASAERVKAADRWSEWRDVFTVSSGDGVTARDDANDQWENVPLWGASERFNDLCRRVKSAIEDGEKKISRNNGGVHCLFFWSQPGTGKEGLSDLCHYLAERSWGGDQFIEQAKRIEKTIDLAEGGVHQSQWRGLIRRLGLVQAEGGIRQSQWNDMIRRFRLNQDQVVEPQHLVERMQKKCFGKNQFPRWKFNKFDVNCSYLSRLGAERELFGSWEDGNKRLGLLTRASWISGTIFFDEFNTLNPEDASLFLRWTEKPFVIEDRALGADVPLNLLCVFASNKSPDELKRAGWNEAVFSRIAKPGRTFEIPPLSERPEDIALFVAKKLCLDNKLTTVDAAGLRLLCELKWPGNYRQLDGFVATLRKNRGEKAEITFQNILDTLLSEGMSLGPEVEP